MSIFMNTSFLNTRYAHISLKDKEEYFNTDDKPVSIALDVLKELKRIRTDEYKKLRDILGMINKNDAIIRAKLERIEKFIKIRETNMYVKKDINLDYEKSEHIDYVDTQLKMEKIIEEIKKIDLNIFEIDFEYDRKILKRNEFILKLFPRLNKFQETNTEDEFSNKNWKILCDIQDNERDYVYDCILSFNSGSESVMGIRIVITCCK
jgi:hypothetical protein